MNTLRSHYRATLRLGMPIAIGQLGVIITGFADTLMVGRYSTDALAAASFVNNIFTLVTFLLIGYSYGLTPLIGAHYGRGDTRGAGGVLLHGMVAGTLYGAVIIAAMGGAYFALDRLGQPADLLPLVRPYYLIILLSMVFVVVANLLRQFTDAITDTATGMWILLGGNALNIAGNALLIYGAGPFPEMGLVGAGIATLLARLAIALALALVVIVRRRYAPYRHGWHTTPLQWRAVKALHHTAFPISLQMGMETGAFTFSAVMAGWLGAAPLAAYQVLVTIGTLGYLFYYSFGAGMSIRIASFVGQADRQRVAQAARAGLHLLIALAVTAGTVLLTAGTHLISLFTTDGAVVAAAYSALLPLVVYQLGDALQVGYANALRATGRVRPMMGIAFVSYLLVNIPLGYLLAFPCHLGLTGLFAAFSAGLFTAAALFRRAFGTYLREA